jgi:hypothetical protein
MKRSLLSLILFSRQNRISSRSKTTLQIKSSALAKTSAFFFQFLIYGSIKAFACLTPINNITALLMRLHN